MAYAPDAGLGAFAIVNGLVHASGEEEDLAQLKDGSFRLGEEQPPERVRFDAVVEGKAQRLNLSGQDLYRSPLS
jgi:hypothetical protein